MDDSNSINIILFVILFVLMCFSAFFSSAEMAYSSLNRIKLKSIAEKSKKLGKRAMLALKLLEIYDKILSTVLIGNNIVNIASSALATAILIGIFGNMGVSIATGVMTVLILIFCEISPKVLAKEAPELTALRTAPVLRFFVWLFTPLSFIAAEWKKLIVKIFSVKQDRSTTEDELLTFVEEVRQEGGINIQEEQMIRQVIGFDDLIASEIYTPRMDVQAVSTASAVEEVDKKFTATGFSRLAVFKDSIDNILGIIHFKDFYREVMKGLKPLNEIIKPVIFVAKTIKIGKLLRTLQEKQAHMAVVVDEHGGALGIITIEDIVEELVGEIWDENEKVVEPVVKSADGSYRVLGNVSFSDMLEFIGIKDSEIPDTTVANWIMEKLGRLPRVGESLEWRNLTIIVTRVLRHRVMEVRVSG
ncbi:MAG: hemolysin family protein [Treponema sp.]|jgi:CBS domain containing-hemolysin-like protein|nr:hemolysin family protein [Treponema sp.]